MRALAIAGLVALWGCASPADNAERRYEIVKESGDATDICAQGKAVVAAYLQANDGEKYKTRRVETDVECRSATGDEQMGIFRMPDGSKKQIEVDNMEAAAPVVVPQKSDVGKETTDPANPCYSADEDC